MKLNLDEMRIQVRRLLCKHNYIIIATHKMSRADLWKCKKCGDMMYQNYNHNITIANYNKLFNEEDWRPCPSSRDLKEEL